MCVECDKLRAEIRELREELAEWERSGVGAGEIDTAEVISAAFSMHPQEGRLVRVLMDSRNTVVSHDELSDRIEYAGADRWYTGSRGEPVSSRRAQLKVVVHRARKWLETGGIFDSIANIRGVGYIMTKQKAAEIQAVLDRE